MFDKLRGPTQFILQIFGSDGKWHYFRSIDAKGIKIGSGERSERIPELRNDGCCAIFASLPRAPS